MIRVILRRFCGAVGTMLLAISLVSLPGTAHAAKWYVDNTLGEVSAEEKVVPETPMPVQVIYEFQRDGTPHQAATRETKDQAVEAIRKSGVFSEVVETPVEGGAVLSIVFNNLVNKEDLEQAKKDGFRAGLGFGLFGGVVATDNYVITFEYLPHAGATPIKTSVEHALHMKYGRKKVEIPGTEYKKVNEAVSVLVRQAMDRGVNNLASDPGFAG